MPHLVQHISPLAAVARMLAHDWLACLYLGHTEFNKCAFDGRYAFNVRYMSMHLIGMHLVVDTHLIGIHLADMLIEGMHLVAIQLADMHFRSIYFVGIYLAYMQCGRIHLHLEGVHLVDLYLADLRNTQALPMHACPGS